MNNIKVKDITKTQNNIYIYRSILMYLDKFIADLSLLSITNYKVNKEPKVILSFFEVIKSLFLGNKVLNEKLNNFRKDSLEHISILTKAILGIINLLNSTLNTELSYYNLNSNIDTKEFKKVIDNFKADLKINNNLQFSEVYLLRDEIVDNTKELFKYHNEDLSKLADLVQSWTKEYSSKNT